MSHVPVLLSEVLEHLAPVDGDVLVDATFGGGGYASAILDQADATLIGIDRDPTAVARAETMQARYPRLIPVRGVFGDMKALVQETGHAPVNGIVLDLGVSSFQIDEPERGFSFQKDGPLDMRMSCEGPDAALVVNTYAEADLANIIYRLGEERDSRRVARAIVKARAETPFTTTLQFADAVETALGGRRGKRTHPATKTFQALRIYINDELGELARALEAAETLLSEGGRLVVVTFHSIEDRMVKSWLTDRSGGGGAGSRHMPTGPSGPAPTFTNVRRVAGAGEEEVSANVRARSARLRSAVRTSAPPRGISAAAPFDLPSLPDVRAA